LQACNNVAIAYDKGRGVSQNSKTAATWFQKAAGMQNPNAQEALGLMLIQGRGVAVDIKGAKYLLEKAGNKGRKDAQFLMGLIYASGEVSTTCPSAYH
jgi:TPR repeat protein